MAATLAAVALASFLWATLASGALSQAPSVELAVQSAKDNDSNGAPSCKGFRGAVHGESTCLRYDRAQGKLSRTNRRVMPGNSTRDLGCGGQLQLRNVSLRLECLQTPPGPGQRAKNVVVEMVVEEDALYPRGRGRRVVLDQHDGFWDFIRVWVAEGKQTLDLTIDYGILE